MSVLWIDDDADDFPAIKRLARQRPVRLHNAYTVEEAHTWILERSENPPSAIILDAILPLGGFKDDGLARYSGLAIAKSFPALSSRIVVLSIVPERILRKSGMRKEIAYFSKLDLGNSLEVFRDLLYSKIERHES